MLFPVLSTFLGGAANGSAPPAFNGDTADDDLLDRPQDLLPIGVLGENALTCATRAVVHCFVMLFTLHVVVQRPPLPGSIDGRTAVVGGGVAVAGRRRRGAEALDADGRRSTFPPSPSFTRRNFELNS